MLRLWPLISIEIYLDYLQVKLSCIELSYWTVLLRSATHTPIAVRASKVSL